MFKCFLQETLREFGIVFWCHHEMRFNGSNIGNLRARAEAVGLVAWTAQRFPTSTFTHEGMLKWFNVSRNQFHFQHMVEPESAIYVNTYRLHHKLLKPWVQCALDVDCLAPVDSRVINIYVLTTVEYSDIAVVTACRFLKRQIAFLGRRCFALLS